MASSAELPLKWGLNAPFGARCFLAPIKQALLDAGAYSLSAPFGARCFLTPQEGRDDLACGGLNAPFGARCFLTPGRRQHDQVHSPVLMHLLALGGF